MLSEVHRIAAEVYCISGNVVSFVLNKGIKNLEQIITIVGNFQHTDHYFFGHNNREFVLVWLVQCWVLRCESVSQSCAAQTVN